jgi:nitrite reductase (NO-forming)
MRRQVAWGVMVLFLLALLLPVLLTKPRDRVGLPASQPQAAAVRYRAERPSGRTVSVSLHARETVQQIAPGVRYHVWTFNGTAPGPVIRVRVGDTVQFTLYNDSTIGMQHSIDFHAAMTPWANLPRPGQATLTGNYQPVDPGTSKTFDWVAMYPGVFMYHCGVAPVLQHIANGMYGAIIVEPANLPREREFVLLSSEFYPGPRPVHGVYEGDYQRMLAVRPSYVVWNGVADQYKAHPLQVRPNEKFRLWVVNAGPTLTTAFHVIGAMFEETHDSGNPANTLYGLQTFDIPPGSGAMFELQIRDPGLYPFVTHAFAYTALGAVGLIEVTPTAPPAPRAYPMLGDPFTAGLTPAGRASPTPTVAPRATAPSPSSSGGAACSPAGATLTVTASNAAFDRTCLAAPAGRGFVITFDNRDPGIPHNVSIYTDSTAAKPLFTGSIITGIARTTYRVKPLRAGTYFFRCDVHPQMNGTFVVG